LAAIFDIAMGQNTPTIRARITPDSIMIGDHFVLEVEITRDVMQVVGLPEFEMGMLNEKVEILAEKDIDTLATEGRTITLKKSYLLTTFDEGYYSMGRFPALYLDKNITDTIWSLDTMKLLVTTFDIDTATMTIYDIRKPLEVPFKIGEISWYLALGLIIATIIALGTVAYMRYRRRLPVLGFVRHTDPPHVIAIRALDDLEKQKFPHEGKMKLYYSVLTDILREYLDGRFGIAAMEMTSEEILDAVRPLGLSQKLTEEFTDLLRCADLVKFAKHIPDIAEAKYSMATARAFIEQTKPEEKVEKTEKENEI
jgi:hypothetical protein